MPRYRGKEADSALKTGELLQGGVVSIEECNLRICESAFRFAQDFLAIELPAIVQNARQGGL